MSGSSVIMWEMKNNNNGFALTWSRTYRHQPGARFGPACEFFNDNTRFCAGQLEDNSIIIFSVCDGSQKKRCGYASGLPFTFFTLVPASSQILVGDTHDFVSIFDLSTIGNEIKSITRCRERQLYPLEVQSAGSGVAECNIAKVMFLMMEESAIPLKFSERWTKEWTIRTLSPSGRYCVLYQRTKQKIQIVKVDELIQSFTFVVKNTGYI